MRVTPGRRHQHGEVATTAGPSTATLPPPLPPLYFLLRGAALVTHGGGRGQVPDCFRRPMLDGRWDMDGLSDPSALRLRTGLL